MIQSITQIVTMIDAHQALLLAQQIVDSVNALSDSGRDALMSSPVWNVIVYVLNILANHAGVVDIIFEDGSIVLEF